MIVHAKKLWAILDFFFTDQTFFRPVPLPTNKKKLTKNSLYYFSLKVKNVYGDGVKNESARTKNLQGEGRQTPPPVYFS